LSVFVSERTIRFAECDPAGIVYFPRFLEMVNDLTEDWFEQSLGIAFDPLHFKRQLGVPVVNTRIDFLKACRLGERLALELAIESLGRSSIVLRVHGLVGDEERIRLRHKVAMVSMQSYPYRATPIPDDLRSRMSAFVLPDATPTPDPKTHSGAIPPQAFRSPQLVRFSHCDPAAIVFYPRFFDLFASVEEDWFAQGLRCPWGTDFMGTRNLRIPTLSITAEFLAACRLSEVVDFDLWVTRLGRSSIELALAGSVAGQPRLRAAMTVCTIDYGAFKSTPIPEDLRARMTEFLAG
jgi:4-hydroxybenzoyl-CoA thioesterase